MRRKYTWLIVGGAGYIGSHVARCFLDNDIDIVIVENLVIGIKERIPEKIKFIKLDCEKYNILSNFIF